LGDLEYHKTLATQFGISAGHSRESRYANDSAPPNATQIKLSDGVNPFEENALAQGVTVQKLDYDEMAVDAGLKLRGFSLQSEYYWRRLSNFQTLGGPVPMNSIFDHGFQVQAMQMVVPTKLGLYAVYGKVFDDFKRNPYEISGGANYYPSGTRSWRLNLHLINVKRSPAASNFGFYTSGQTGTTISAGIDILM